MSDKKYFSTTGFAYLLFSGAALGVEYLAAFLLARFAPEVYGSEACTWILSFLPMYLVGAPLCVLVMRRIRPRHLYQHGMTGGNWMAYFCISFFFMVVGGMVGNGLNDVFSRILGRPVTNDLSDLIDGSGIGWVIVFAVVLGPVMEELLCRKLLIDRMIIFGDRTAIVLSGLVFGLLHGNFYQFFYAFAVGCVFAYVYIRSGHIGYSIAMHMSVNFFGSVVPLLLTRNINVEQMPSETRLYQSLLSGDFSGMIGGYAIYAGYVLFMIVLFTAGLICLIRKFRIRILRPGERSCRAKIMAGNMFGNPGMILFLIYAAVMFAVSILAG